MVSLPNFCLFVILIFFRKTEWEDMFWIVDTKYNCHILLIVSGSDWAQMEGCGDQMHQGALSAFATALCRPTGYPSVYPGPASPG